MRNCVRHTPVLVLACALVLGGTSRAQAQDTSQVSADTSEYQSYGGADTSASATQSTGGADSGAAGYTGPPADTGLEAEPGVQTGSAAGDTVEVGKASAPAEDALVCNDGSNAARTDGCVRNGGIDWAATEAATKARDEPVDATKPR